MKTEIYCKPTEKGIHSFYLVMGSEEFFLFSQAYRKGVDFLHPHSVLCVQANFDLMQGVTTEYKSLLEEKKRIKE